MDFELNQVSTTVDWLSYTVPWHAVQKDAWATHDGQHAAVSVLTGIWEDWQRDIPLHGYEDAWTTRDGGAARVMVSRPGHEMGIHVQLPGQALAKLDPLRAMANMRFWQGRPTRIDLAADVRGESDPEDLYAMLEDKFVITRAQKYTRLTGTTGSTVYVGSRASEKFLRVYDKAAQTKTDGNWTRIELECKGGYAGYAAQQVGELGYTAIGPIIRAFVDAPDLPWYHDALTREQTDIGAPQAKKMTDTRRWLMETCAKTLAKETREDPEFLMEFLRRVQALRAPWISEEE